MSDESPNQSRLEVRLASTPTEVQACEEVIRMGFGRVMRLGVEPEADEQRALTTFYCIDVHAGRILATSRLVGLDYLSRSEALVREYRIGKFPDELRARSMLSFQSAALPDQRGTEVMSLLFRGVFKHVVDGGHLTTVSACKPYLYPYFVSMGFRAYDDAYISTEGGYRIPIVLINHDGEHLRACKSLFATELAGRPEAPGAAMASGWFAQNAAAPEGLNVRIISRPEHMDFDLGFLRGLDEATIRAIFRWAVIISCRRDDQIVKENAQEQVIGFILDGAVDVIKGSRTIKTLKAGEIFGEVGFLLKVPRTASLSAAADNTRIAFISMHSIDAIKDPAQASVFWRNLSTEIAGRLQHTTELL